MISNLRYLQLFKIGIRKKWSELTAYFDAQESNQSLSFKIDVEFSHPLNRVSSSDPLLNKKLIFSDRSHEGFFCTVKAMPYKLK